MNTPPLHARMHTRRPVLVLIVLALVGALGLAGCGGDDTDGGNTRTVDGQELNDADVAFATDMIEHHAQALEMVDLTMGRDLDPEVAALAEEIRAAQTPEIEQLTDWLVSWDEPVPATSRDHANSEGGGMGDMDHGNMPGMMADEDMSALEEAPDGEFQDMWLNMMIEHHEGAVEMAQAEQADGAFQPAIDMAADIEKSQTEEIDTMTALLGQS